MSPTGQWVPGVKKIAVLRANAVGDFVLAQPALYALKAAYPQAEIVLLGRPWHADYLTGRPGPISRVFPVPPYTGVSEPDTWTGPDAAGQAAIDSFFARAQTERFDLAIQMHGGGGNSNPFILRLGAHLTAGMCAPGAPLLDRWMPYVYWQHEILRLLEVAGLVGAPPITFEPLIQVTDRDMAEACEFLADTGHPLAVIHPGASDSRRRWPAERFAAVGDALARAGCQVVVIGIPAEQNTVQAVIGQMNEPALNLCGVLSLQGLTGLLARATLVVANDSGPRHLAEALGTPTVGIFWCGNLINAGPAFRAIHRPHLSWRLECPICGKNTLQEPCQHEVSFVDGVTTEAVVESAMDLLRGR
jgi:ADP-heptose:LPS heptosyltransferase